MDVTQIDTTDLTHILFAFAIVTSGWQVDIEAVREKFEIFRDMQTNVKKILSFEGWAFSADPETFKLFRDATKPANREAFASKFGQVSSG